MSEQLKQQNCLQKHFLIKHKFIMALLLPHPHIRINRFTSFHECLKNPMPASPIDLMLLLNSIVIVNSESTGQWSNFASLIS